MSEYADDYIREAAATGRLFQCDVCRGPVPYIESEDSAALAQLEQHVCSNSCFETANAEAEVQV